MDNITYSPSSTITSTTPATILVTTEPTPLASPFVFNVIFLIQSSLVIFSALMNGAAILIFLKHKQLRSPTNTFIMNLILCDLLMAFTASICAMNAYNHGWAFGPKICVMEGFLVYFFGLTSLYLLAAISLDRYFVIARPLSASKITHRVAMLCTSACWVFGFFWAACPLVGWNEYVTEGITINCSVVWDSPNPSYTSYIMCIFFACFLIPLLLVAFAYYKVYMTVKNVTRNNVWDTKSRVARRNLRVEKKMLKTCILMVVVFVGCWLPYCVVSFVAAFYDPTVITPIMATIPALVAKSAGMWNPLIYVATNKQFRYGFYAIVPCKGLKDAMVKKEEQKPESDEEDEDDKTAIAQNVPDTSRGKGNAVAPADDNAMEGEVTVIEDMSQMEECTTTEVKEAKKD